MTDGNGAQSKRSKLMSTFNNFTSKSSHHHQNVPTTTIPTTTSMNFSSSSTAGGGGGGFPSFRFSPDSEELEEICSSNSTIASNISTDERHAESLPDSPKLTSTTSGASGGDTSPIKEYIRKNWATKWDKRSMSLDLDLKGKIITAIEDKRKSMLSHFIPEETSGIVIPPSSSIQEHTGVAVSLAAGETGATDNMSTTSNNDTCSLSSNNSSIISTTNTTEVDSKTHHRSSQLNHSNFKFSFDNTSKQVHLSNDASGKEGDNLSLSSTDETYEEVGLDYLENMTTAGQIDASILENIFPFSFQPEQLEETNLGVSLASVIKRQDGGVGDDVSAIEFSMSSSASESRTDLEIGSVVNDMFKALLLNPVTMVLFIFISAGLFVPMHSALAGFYWFVVGVLTTVAVNQSLFGDPADLAKDRRELNVDVNPSQTPFGPNLSNVAGVTATLNQKHQRSQGWMTELEGEYDPFTYHVRQSKVVFVRMEGSFLYISYPHSKNRISKRRFWSDPPLSTEVLFQKHLIYNLLNSHIFIAPEKLARRRVWNKKYPIGIKLAKFSIVSTITQVDSATKTSGNSTTGSTAQGAQTQPEPSTTTEANIYRKGDKQVSRDDCGEKVLYLFARTDREKDDWYRRLVGAAKEERPFQLNKDKSELSNYVLQKLYLACMNNLIPKPLETKNASNNEPNREAISLTEKAPQTEKQPSPPLDRKVAAKEKPQTEKKTNQDKTEDSTNSSGSSKRETPTDTFTDLEKILTIPQSPVFLNAFLGRVFFDFLRSSHWTASVQKLIQKKLNYIRRPQFLDALLVRDIDLGHAVPVIQRASSPFIDSQGLWIDLDITYEGNLCVTLETKLNLMKLRKSPTGDTDQQAGGQSSDPTHNQPSSNSAPADEHSTSGESRPPNFLDSDADDSGESSDDEEVDPEDFLAQQELTSSDLHSSSDTSTGKPSKGAKFLRMAEKIANSNFVTEVKVVKKVIANVANIPLVLSVELKSVNGTLALNIPPPPTDRLWLGFRTNPDMQVVAKPKVGERSINLTHVTEFIRKKIIFEFQRVMVLPNMDDLTIPLMEFKLPTY